MAQRDAEAAYGDLSFYSITVFCGPDGWHIDYELTEPLVAGGGPHYVIDPRTAASSGNLRTVTRLVARIAACGEGRDQQGYA